MSNPEYAREYYFTDHNVVQLQKIGRSIATFIVEKRSEESESFYSNSD
jgi:hypothetical protein